MRILGQTWFSYNQDIGKEEKVSIEDCLTKMAQRVALISWRISETHMIVDDLQHSDRFDQSPRRVVKYGKATTVLA